MWERAKKLIRLTGYNFPGDYTGSEGMYKVGPKGYELGPEIPKPVLPIFDFVVKYQSEEIALINLLEEWWNRYKKLSRTSFNDSFLYCETRITIKKLQQQLINNMK